MVRAFVLYQQEPDAERYAQHVELCRKVPGANAFRRGPVFGAPAGEPRYRYYAEWEFPSMDAFKTAARTPEFAATAPDAQAMGIPMQAYFADVSE